MKAKRGRLSIVRGKERRFKEGSARFSFSSIRSTSPSSPTKEGQVDQDNEEAAAILKGCD